MPRKVVFISVFIALGLVLITIYQRFTLEDGKLHLVFCNVGQGDAIFIRTPKGGDLIIDGGPDDQILNCLGRHMPFWDRQLEMAILTHPQADHLVGLTSIIKSYSLMLFASSVLGEETEGLKELKRQIKRKKIETITVKQGDRFATKDGILLQVLWPAFAGASTGEPNDLSVVSLLSYGEFKILLTGDAGAQISNQIENMPNVDVLKIPHHGSQTSLDEQFLNKVKPRLAIISVGKNNSYGHPAPETIKILSDKEIKILRTDEDGEIEIITDGKKCFLIQQGGFLRKKKSYSCPASNL